MYITIPGIRIIHLFIQNVRGVPTVHVKCRITCYTITRSRRLDIIYHIIHHGYYTVAFCEGYSRSRQDYTGPTVEI